MKDNQKRPDTPLAETPVTILDDIQKRSDEYLKKVMKGKERRRENAKQAPTPTLQGLATLKNTLGKSIINKKS